MKNLLLLVALVCTVISCGKDENTDTAALTTADVLGCWMHDYETESENGGTYYMTLCDAKDFPSSLWRYSLIIEKDRMGSELQLAANDGHFYTDITWTLRNDILES